jgi:hypothetical protein
MRFFTLKLKIGRIELFGSKVTTEIPLMSMEARAALNYDALQKAALAHERRAIDMHLHD